MAEELFRDLNPPQKEAVAHGEGPLLVLAGAGSGKTRVLTYRIAYLVREKGTPPHRILALTFTNKAAGEMKSRVEKLLGGETSLWIGTFHSIFARILRRHAEILGYTHNYTIYDTDDSQRLVKNIIKELPQSPGTLNPASVRHAISRYKNELRSPEEVRQGQRQFIEGKTAEIYEIYEKKLKENNAMDFDDLILKPSELFRTSDDLLERYRNQFVHLLIDEFQDTNRAQYNLIRLLTNQQQNVCVVGDDDQSIYGWRGADIRNIFDFERDFKGATTVRLEQNYRSTGNILEVANAVVSRNEGRKPKKLWTNKEHGARSVIIETHDEIDEAEQVAEHAARVRSELGLGWLDIAVLYRTNAQSRALEDAMRKARIPYRIIGGLRFYERKEIKDLLAYLKMIANPQDSGSLYRIINVPARGIGPVTLTRLTRLALLRGEPLYHVLGDADQAGDITQNVAQKVMDLHTMFEDLRALSRSESAAVVLKELIKLSGYESELSELDKIEFQTRMENIEELGNAVAEFSERFTPEDDTTCLEAWLAETSLVSEIDFHNPEEDYLTLMTLHNAKGLEFPVVFISGLEQNLLPISRAFEDEKGFALEEERRLFYVGITRAKEKLFLSWAANRRRFGEILDSEPSQFLRDIPGELVEHGSSLRCNKKLLNRYTRDYAGSPGKFARGPIGPAPPIFAPAAAPVSVGSEPAFERDPGVDEPAYRKGERVVHNAFGSGTITDINAYLDDLRVTVRFDSGVSKKLMARFARLRRE
ncbi:MAG TPA: UvrD-helicase domain-containing protein [archaeon]|nr:UvrD-helicase domain-containing protein [archaeon]